MSGTVDWEWKLRETVERLRTRYDHIGRKTGAPFLAVVYPPEAERHVVKEWHALAASLDPDFSIRPVDVLAVTSAQMSGPGVEAIVGSMASAMPGSDPTAELGAMWTHAVGESVRATAARPGAGRPVVVLYRLGALYPASGPRAVMQALWDRADAALNGPVVLFIPGVIAEPRVYRFVGRVEEFMYRGDIL